MNEINVLLLFGTLVPEFVITMVDALRRLEGAILEIVSELAIRSGDPALNGRFLYLPKAYLAFAFAIMIVGESANEAILELPFCH